MTIPFLKQGPELAHLVRCHGSAEDLLTEPTADIELVGGNYSKYPHEISG
jgi:hypothetical protein